MLSKLDRYFDPQKLVFCPYAMPCYPDNATYKKYIDALVVWWASMIEIQIPFCDPAADGVVLTAIHDKIVSEWITTQDALDMIIYAKKTYPDVWICVMSYANSVFNYTWPSTLVCENGQLPFLAFLSEHGVDALLVPDIPAEEIQALPDYGNVASVRIVSENLSDQQIKTIADSTTWFLYVLTTIATTWWTIKKNNLPDFIARIRSIVWPDKKLVVWFGIRDAQDIESLRQLEVDGFVIASQLMRELQSWWVAQVVSYITSLQI